MTSEPTPVPPPEDIYIDPVGPFGTIDRVAQELLILLGRAGGRHASPGRRVLLGDVAAAIEEYRSHWVDERRQSSS